MFRLVVLALLLVAPGQAAPAWDSHEPGILRFVVMDCDEEVQARIQETAGRFNRIAERDETQVRLMFLPVWDRPHDLAEMYRTRDHDGVRSLANSQAVDGVVGCIPFDTLVAAGSPDLIAVTMVTGRERVHAALVLMPTEALLPVPGCEDPVPLGPEAWSDVLLHEVFHLAGVHHTHDRNDLMYPVARPDGPECETWQRLENREPGPSTMQRLRVAWPPTAASDANVARFDAANTQETPASILALAAVLAVAIVLRRR